MRRLKDKSMSSLENICNDFKDQVVRQGYLFWRTDPPRDYMTGLLFKGLNFLILGLNPFNRIDHRWISEGNRKKSQLHLKEDAVAQKIIIFSVEKDFDNIEIFSTTCWNVQMLDAGLPPATSSTKSLTDVLPQIKIPFKNEHGIAYFSVRKKIQEGAFKNALALDPLSFLRELCCSYLPRIRTVSYDDPVAGTQDAAYDELIVEIASCRIAHTLGCMTPLDAHAGYIRKLVSRLKFDEPKHQLMLSRAFRDASELEERLLTEDDISDEFLQHDLVNPFVSPEEWDLLINDDLATAAKQMLLENLIRACDECRKSDTDDIAYIRYISDLNDEITDTEAEVTEFYATSIQGDGTINGILKTSRGNLRISLDPEVLWANFTVEITHVPHQINL